MTMI
jgi:hypothetical protein